MGEIGSINNMGGQAYGTGRQMQDSKSNVICRDFVILDKGSKCILLGLHTFGNSGFVETN